MKILLVYITYPSQKLARVTAKNLVKQKLAACCNLFPVESIYRWQRKIRQEKECVLIAKTVAAKFPALQKFVENVHPYSTPFIGKFSVKINEKYFRWLQKELK